MQRHASSILLLNCLCNYLKAIKDICQACLGKHIFLTLSKSSNPITKTSMGETGCLGIFFEATTLCHNHSTLACQTYEGLHQLSSTATLGFFECLHIQFFNSSHVTYGTPCCTRGHSHSPREVEDFPRGGSHSGHMPPPTYLA